MTSCCCGLPGGRPSGSSHFPASSCQLSGYVGSDPVFLVFGQLLWLAYLCADCSGRLLLESAAYFVSSFSDKTPGRRDPWKVIFLETHLCCCFLHLAPHYHLKMILKLKPARRCPWPSRGCAHSHCHFDHGWFPWMSLSGPDLHVLLRLLLPWRVTLWGAFYAPLAGSCSSKMSALDSLRTLIGTSWCPRSSCPSSY